MSNKQMVDGPYEYDGKYYKLVEVDPECDRGEICRGCALFDRDCEQLMRRGVITNCDKNEHNDDLVFEEMSAEEYSEWKKNNIEQYKDPTLNDKTVGDTFIYRGMEYVINKFEGNIEKGCEECVFYPAVFDCAPLKKDGLLPECYCKLRKDQTNVYFTPTHSKKDDLNVGDTFEFNGSEYKVTGQGEVHGCTNCAFEEDEYCKLLLQSGAIPECLGLERHDQKDVVFTKVEKSETTSNESEQQEDQIEKQEQVDLNLIEDMCDHIFEEYKKFLADQEKKQYIENGRLYAEWIISSVEQLRGVADSAYRDIKNGKVPTIPSVITVQDSVTGTWCTLALLSDGYYLWEIQREDMAQPQNWSHITSLLSQLEGSGCVCSDIYIQLNEGGKELTRMANVWRKLRKAAKMLNEGWTIV